jgi:sphinganine-1-phosphate aldolase
MNTMSEIRLPTQGVSWAQLEHELVQAGRGDVDWRGGRVPMFIHYAGEEALDVAKKAYAMYFSENGLGPRAFGSLARFEREVVAMGLGLLHGGPGARGAMTTGGTESIFLAVKCARDSARERGRQGPLSIVLPYSAHPAFDKAAHFMELQVVRVPLGADLRADPAAMEAAITPQTVLLVGSAPAFPHGLVDPIGALAEIAQRHGLWMHVDACVGGYFIPFARQLGARVDDFDFAVPGVTSISADLHKYGYTAKGASTLFFAQEADFARMGWHFDAWPRGQYFTHSLVGTRAGGAIAAAWAVLRFLGEEGYLHITQRVLDTRARLQQGAAALGLPTLGDPQLSILAYGSPERDMAAVGQGMTDKGWTTGYVRAPDGLHHMLNLTHEPVVEQYLADLAEVLREPATQRAGRGVQAQY